MMSIIFFKTFLNNVTIITTLLGILLFCTINNTEVQSFQFLSIPKNEKTTSVRKSIQTSNNYNVKRSPSSSSSSSSSNLNDINSVNKNSNLLSRLLSSKSNSDDIGENDDKNNNIDKHRRNLLLSGPMTMLLQQILIGSPSSVSARGLVQFPCNYGLANSYHFLRVGETMLEEEGIWSTNPLFLTNREDALSIEGIEQVIVACQQLNLLNRSPTLVKYSLAASCIDTSNIVQRELKLGRDRIVPEFTFLDPRAIGKWDMMSKKQVEPAILAYDHDNAGNDGLGARPPPNDDGTPNETLNDQVIRLRQLLSILESQYSGDTILLIFPDGTGPALLSAMIAGIPFNRVHQLEYSPGEVRFDITYESTRKLYNEKNTLASQRNSVVSYEQKLAIGRKNLIELHTNNPENGGIGYINMKDEKLEKDRLEVVEAVAAKGRQRKLIEDEAENVRQQRQIQYNNENDSELNPTVFGAAGLLATAGIGLIVGRDETAESNIVYNDKTKGNVGFSSDSSNVLVTATANGAIMNMTTDSGSSLYASISQQRQRVNGDSKGLYSSPPVIVDPKVAAEKAMQEYLDRDDGADDWLQAMADIIEEPDDDDELVIDDKHNQVWNSSSFQ